MTSSSVSNITANINSQISLKKVLSCQFTKISSNLRELDEVSVDFSMMSEYS